MNFASILRCIALTIIILGPVIDGHAQEHNHAEHSASGANAQTIWTCSMDPQVRATEPGDCPICGMDLIELRDSSSAGATSVTLSKNAIALARVASSTIEATAVEHEITMVGSVAIDQSRSTTVAARVAGRIDTLHVDYLGKKVAVDEPLFTIYSPAVIEAWDELLLNRDNPRRLKLIKTKFKLWGFGDKQIEKLAQSSEVGSHVTIVSAGSGTVLSKKVNEGDYVKEGQKLFEISDLSRVWVLLEAFEHDIAWLKLKQKVTIESSAYPGKKIEGTISFIDPHLNPRTRSVALRVEAANSDELLKLGMYVKAKVQIAINRDPKEQKLLVPRSAVLYTGKRSLVYLDRSEGVYEPTTIELGSRVGNYYIVNEGLTAGDKVVSSGAFKVDSASQLAGKTSMMSIQANERGAVQSVSAAPIAQDANLDDIIAPLLKLSDALAADNMQQAATHASTLYKLSSANAALSTINKLAMQIAHATEITEQRRHFKPLSEGIIASLKADGAPADLNIMLCPMAGEGGSLWLQRDSAVRNPYYGAAMFRCGSVKESLNKKMGDTSSAVVPATTTIDFKKLVATLLQLTDALAADDMTAATKASTELYKLSTAASTLKTTNRLALKIAHAKDIGEQRRHFKPLSEGIISFLKEGNAPENLNIMLCPMAGPGGSLWLQRDSAVRNPYYGAAMFRCGSVKEKITKAADDE